MIVITGHHADREVELADRAMEASQVDAAAAHLSAAIGDTRRGPTGWLS